MLAREVQPSDPLTLRQIVLHWQGHKDAFAPKRSSLKSRVGNLASHHSKVERSVFYSAEEPFTLTFDPAHFDVRVFFAKLGYGRTQVTC